MWGNVGGSSRSGRIVTTRDNRDRWWRFATVRQFSIDLENIHCGVPVMVCKEMSADRPDRDGSWRSVTTVTDGEGSLWWCYGEGRLCWRIFCGLNISANRLELNWSLYLLQLLRIVTFCDLLSVRCGLRKYSLRCYGVRWKCLHGSLRTVIAVSDGFCCDISLLPSEYGLFCKVIIVQLRAVIFGEFINIHAFTSE